jgi:hypothetical protein
MKNLYTAVIFSLITTNIFSQVDTTKLQSESVQVFKSYQANINTSQRKTIHIKAPKVNKISPTYSYNLSNNVAVDFERAEPSIRPLNFNEDRNVLDQKNGMIYGAYGNLKTIKAGGNYHYFIEDWLEAGVQVDHHSNSSIVTAQQFSPDLNSTSGKLYGSYFINDRTKLGVEGHASINNRSSMIYYDNFESIDIDYPLRNIGGVINLSHNSFEKNGFSVKSKLSADRFRQVIDTINSNVSESNIAFDNNIYKKLTSNFSAEVDVNFQSIKIDNDVESKSNDLILRPRLRYKSDLFSLVGGVEYLKGTNISFVFPIIDFRIENIIEEVDFRLFTQSNFMRNSLSNLTSQNPYFIGNNLDSLSSSYIQSYSLEVSRDINDWTTGISLGYFNINNDVQFINLRNENALRSPIFTADYISRNEIAVTPRIEYNSELVDLDLFFTYHHFLDEAINEGSILYRPKYEIGISSKQKLFDNKLIISQTFVYSDVRFGRDTEGFTAKLDPILDLAVTVDYKLTSSFTVFGEVYNLLDTEYRVWNSIDNYGRHLWGGIRFKF